MVPNIAVLVGTFFFHHKNSTDYVKMDSKYPCSTLNPEIKKNYFFSRARHTMGTRGRKKAVLLKKRAVFSSSREIFFFFSPLIGLSGRLPIYRDFSRIGLGKVASALYSRQKRFHFFKVDLAKEFARAASLFFRWNRNQLIDRIFFSLHSENYYF